MNDITQNQGKEIRALSNNKLTQENAEQIFRAISALLMIAADKSPERIKMSILMRIDDGVDLTETEVDAIYRLITGDTGVSPYGEGDGSEKNPIVINLTTTSRGVAAEYAYLEKKYGIQGKDFEVVMQKTGNQGKKCIDVLVFKLPDKPEQEIFFDITAFYGK